MLLFKVPPIISQFQPMQPNYSLMGFPKPVPPPAVSVPQPHQILRDMTPFLGEAWTHCMYHSALEEEEEEIIKPMIHPHLLVLIPNVSEVINHVYRWLSERTFQVERQATGAASAVVLMFVLHKECAKMAGEM